MPTTLHRAEGDVINRIARIMKANHRELSAAEVTIDCLMAFNEDGDAVLLHGYKCAAVVRKVSYKNRVLGRADAEIVIDASWWEDASDRGRDGLIDHELTHLELQINKRTRAIKHDRAGRPKLLMRLHDWEIGGFREVAERFGKDAPEVQVARSFKDKFGQFVFDFGKARA